MEILLDGKLIFNKEILFSTLKEQINSEDFQGNNLDALWDVLSSERNDLIITIKNKFELENNLVSYLDSLLNLFNDLSKNNVNVFVNSK